MNLTNHFLISMPNLLDDMFNNSVVYLCEHNKQGALGLIINKPVADLSLHQLFNKTQMQQPVVMNTPIYYGGPVQTERGFILYDHTTVPEEQRMSSDLVHESTLEVTPEIHMTSSQEMLDVIAKGEGPEDFLITLGYAGWGGGQLEDELRQNHWLTVQADAELIFKRPFQDRFQDALRMLGVDLTTLVSRAGHA